MEHLVDKIAANFQMNMPEQPPSLSLIIPTFNCFERMGVTLESIKRQEYPNLELIIVDAGSTDHTLQVIHNYASMVARIYSVSAFHPPEMLNRGIALATSRYITTLNPGSFYISNFALQAFAARAVSVNFPELIHGGAIQRELRREPIQLNSPLSENLLRLGKMPTPLAVCWFRSDIFETVGKIDVRYTYRFALDLFCRIEAMREKRVEQMECFFVDYDYGVFTYKKGLRYAFETWGALKRNFGIKKATIWFLTLDHIQLLRFVMTYLKDQIFKK